MLGNPRMQCIIQCHDVPTKKRGLNVTGVALQQLWDSSAIGQIFRSTERISCFACKAI